MAKGNGAQPKQENPAMTVAELIQKLQTMPQYADVAFDDLDNQEYRDITVELGDAYEDRALVVIGLAE